MRLHDAMAVLLAIAIGAACAERRTEVRPAPPPAGTVLLKAPAPPPDAPTVVVDDLEGEGIDDLGRCAAQVGLGVAQSGRAHVVLRSEIAAQMKECIDVDCQQRVSAPLLAARYVVHGSANRLGDGYVVHLKLLQPDGAAVLARITRQGPGDLQVLLFEAGREVGEALPVK
ncbi:MAG: hypothetical protein JXR83_03300 [Deltaproteobacteria bacterium]|nr:hypothetical protein [Deltaproteobacteria bacterium]